MILCMCVITLYSRAPLAYNQTKICRSVWDLLLTAEAHPQLLVTNCKYYGDTDSIGWLRAHTFFLFRSLCDRVFPHPPVNIITAHYCRVSFDFSKKLPVLTLQLFLQP